MDALGMTHQHPSHGASFSQEQPRGRRIKEPDTPAPSRLSTPGTVDPDGLHVPTIDPYGVRTAQAGTALWGAALVMLLPFYGWLAQTDRLWWLWVCCAGLGLGLIGTDVCRQRRDQALGESAEEPASRSRASRNVPPTTGGGRRRR